MKKAKYIELLSPAKNLECGIEAIKHGADAVYIGAPRFGARAGATNSIDDIRQLVEFAHIYRVKIYVTVNTILRDDELKDTEEMIWELYKIGVDALIVQDFALLSLNLPPIPLHASTQMDNRTPEQAKFLADLGFEQVVLARELSIGEISEIHKATDVPLEVFVHGALCVSYSGQCYVSQHCYNRSANRGECAQFCRLAFDMIDADGKTIHKAKHLLSLKDMNQSENLEALMDAGARSFKIEGRLKDVSYVKNVVAAYSQRLNAVIAKHPQTYCRASKGRVAYSFQPNLKKTFNRGFTSYFLHGRQADIFSPDTPRRWASLWAPSRRFAATRSMWLAPRRLPMATVSASSMPTTSWKGSVSIVLRATVSSRIRCPETYAQVWHSIATTTRNLNACWRVLLPSVACPFRCIFLLLTMVFACLLTV